MKNMNKIQYVVPGRGKTLIHVETGLGIVNIYLGLVDSEGRNVERVEVIPDHYVDEPKIVWYGCNGRLVQEKPE